MADFYGSLAADIDTDDESQISDVDPADIAKHVQDMDDLDADLFASSHKTRTRVATATTTTMSSPKKSSLKQQQQQQSVGDSDEKQRHKSRVSFDSPNKVAPATNMTTKDFDEADPLADLLSDEDSLSSKKKTNENKVVSPVKHVGISPSTTSVDSSKAIAVKKDKSKVISDLFGLGSDDADNKVPTLSSPTRKEESKDKQVPSSRSSDWLGIQSPVKTPLVKASQSEPSQAKLVSSKSPVSPKKSGRDTNAEDDDLLEGMGFSDKKVSKTLSSGKVPAGSSKSKSLMDDLFGISTSDSSKGKLSGIPTSPDKKVDTVDVAESGNPVSFGSYAPSVSTSREPRRSASRQTLSVPDPLGIFSASRERDAESSLTAMAVESVAKTGDQSSKNAKPEAKPQVPSDHVGGHVSPVHHVVNPVASSTNLPQWLGGTGVTPPAAAVGTLVKDHVLPARTEPVTVSHVSTEETHVPPQLQSQLQPDTGVGAGVLGQVLDMGSRLEQDLSTSLDRQETQLLNALQYKQQYEQLSQVHRRQQLLLQRQEAQLQSLVERQLERQSNMEAQLVQQQQRISMHIQALLSQPVILPTVSDIITQASQPCDVTADKETVQAQRPATTAVLDIETRHKEELDMLESYYKRHISLLECSSERMETRLRDENTRLQQEYQTRINKLQEEQEQLEMSYKQKLSAVQEEKLRDLKHIKELYKREVDDLKEHYTRVAVMEQDNTIHTRSLQLLCEQLGQSSERLTALEVHADDKQRSQLDIRDAALQAKEQELKITREALDRQQSACEKERERLVSLVSELELRAAEQRADVDARTWELKQETAKLEARTRALQTETQRTQAQLQQERRQVQELKQSILNEQKQVSEQLKQEQLKLSAEKSRLEAMARLQCPPQQSQANVDIEQVRAEAEAAMQVAIDTTRQAEDDRYKLSEYKKILIKEQSALREKERELTVRSHELDILHQVAVATKEEGMKALKECRELQQQHAARVEEHRTQLSYIKERERKLTEEKAILSQERRVLQKMKEEEKYCSFCRMLLEQSGGRAATTTASSHLKPSHKKFVDPQQVILRLTGERDIDYISSQSVNLQSSLISK